MKLYTFLFFFMFFLFGCTSMQAQSKGYVYVDSSLMYTAEDTVVSNSQAPEEDELDTSAAVVNYAADTGLVNNDLVLSRDSIRALKNAKPFAYAKNLDSLLIALQKEQMEAASNIQPEKPSLFERFLSSDITKIIFWGLACFFVLFIVYKLFFTQGFLQRSSAKTPVNLLTSEDEDMHGSADYDRQIAAAIGHKNYRLATRYLYLQSIQKLADANAIVFATDKTNSQYMHELSDKPYRGEFNSLTLNYEYVWYGEFYIDEPAFDALQARFKKFNGQIKII